MNQEKLDQIWENFTQNKQTGFINVVASETLDKQTIDMIDRVWERNIGEEKWIEIPSMTAKP